MLLALFGANIVSEASADPKKLVAADKCPGHVQGVRYYRSTTWRFQDLLQQKRSKTTYNPYKHSCDYTVYTAKVWRSRANRLVNYWQVHGRYIQADRDFQRALLFASHVYGVSYSWLHNCAGSEGGFRDWIWNHRGSKAGGWMQFMSGTFYDNVEAAFSYARRHGYNVSGKYASWKSRVGQAFVAAYMFKTGESGQWTGEGC